MSKHDHPAAEFAVALGFLTAAGGALVWNLTRANQLHELGTAPLVLILSTLSAVLTWRGVRRLGTGAAGRHNRAWRVYGPFQGLLCSGAAAGALWLFVRWIGT